MKDEVLLEKKTDKRKKSEQKQRSGNKNGAVN